MKENRPKVSPKKRMETDAKAYQLTISTLRKFMTRQQNDNCEGPKLSTSIWKWIDQSETTLGLLTNQKLLSSRLTLSSKYG